MPTTAEKLGIKPNSTIWLSNPAQLTLLTPMPDGVREVDTMATASTAVIFANDTAAARRLLEEHAADLTKPAELWVAYLQGESPDLNRDALGPTVADFGLRPNAQVSIDDRWSALRLRPNREG
jgi:hypothetical protein